MGSKGIIASTAGLSILLQEGIGDTIRVSLTPRPGGDRTEEVQVAQQVLQSLGLRSFTPQVTACPGCGRTPARSSRKWLSRSRRTGTSAGVARPLSRFGELRVAVMGCVVNGQESKHADIGIHCPGRSKIPRRPSTSMASSK
jgi:(E)-4-hydroxy-3-methylbut-2-enyl-diphosphate synthase